jgi:Flp pilus assembly protein CpaB
MSRIDSGTILVAFFAILFGLVGAYMLRNSLRSKNVVQPSAPVVRRGPQKITVPLASRNLESGTQITLDDVALFSLTRDEMKEHGIKRVFMSNPDQIIGKTVAVDLKRGSTFDTKDFYAPGTGPGIAHQLKPGQRAVTVEIDATNALLGFAGAGQNVDVLFHFGQDARTSVANRYGDGYDATNPGANNSDTWYLDYNPPRSTNTYANNYANDYDHNSRRRSGFGQKYQSATVTLVQKATILALGQRVNQTGNSSRLGPEPRVRVTLAVKPESAELIRVAEGHGELSLTLRGEDDDEIVEADAPIVLSDIMKMDDPVQMARQEVRDVDVYRGQSRSRIRFTRDRDTGMDDFQRWMVVEPVESPDRNRGGSQSKNGRPMEASQNGLTGPRDRDLGKVDDGSPTPRLSADRRWRAQHRLPSDFRKIQTLFNQQPDRQGGQSRNQSRNQSQNQSQNQSAPVNIEQPSGSASKDLSSRAAQGIIRAAKQVELFNPGSWK